MTDRIQQAIERWRCPPARERHEFWVQVNAALAVIERSANFVNGRIETEAVSMAELRIIQALNTFADAVLGEAGPEHAPDCAHWDVVLPEGDEPICNCGYSERHNARRAATKENT